MESAGILIGGSLNAVVVPLKDWDMAEHSNVCEVHVTGGMDPVDSFATLVTLDGKMTFVADANSFVDLADLAKDTAGVLTAFDTIIGTYKHTGCKVSNLGLNAALEQELRASIAWQALAKGVGVNPGGASPVEAFKCIKLTATNIGTTVHASTIDINVNNELKVIHAMNATGQRTPQCIVEIKRSTTFNMKLTDLPSVPADITAIALAKIATVTMAFESTAASPKVLTISMTNCTPSEQNKNGSKEDIVMHGLNYTAETIDWARA